VQLHSAKLGTPEVWKFFPVAEHSCQEHSTKGRIYNTYISHPQVHTSPHVSTSPSKQVHKSISVSNPSKQVHNKIN
jgi:hypothetical protein